MSYSLYNHKALEQHTSDYKGLYNYALFASLFYTLYVLIRQIVEVNPSLLCVYNGYVHSITIQQIKYYF